MKVGWVCQEMVKATGLPFVCKIGYCPDCEVYHQILKLYKARVEEPTPIPDVYLKAWD